MNKKIKANSESDDEREKFEIPFRVSWLETAQKKTTNFWHQQASLIRKSPVKN